MICVSLTWDWQELVISPVASFLGSAWRRHSIPHQVTENIAEMLSADKIKHHHTNPLSRVQQLWNVFRCHCITSARFLNDSYMTCYNEFFSLLFRQNSMIIPCCTVCSIHFCSFKFSPQAEPFVQGYFCRTVACALNMDSRLTNIFSPVIIASVSTCVGFFVCLTVCLFSG